MTVRIAGLRAYLAGPMRGYDLFNFPAFDEAAKYLRSFGWNILSPAEHDREAFPDFDPSSNSLDGFDIRAALQWDLAQILDPDTHAVIVLPGWESSVGCALEVVLAGALDKSIYAYTPDAHHTPWVQISPAWKMTDGTTIDELEQLHVSTAELAPRAQLLREAEQITVGSRNATYGSPTQDFERTAALWSVYLERLDPLSPHDVAAMMVLLKISRLVHSPNHRDSWLDLAGYGACGWECVATEAAT